MKNRNNHFKSKLKSRFRIFIVLLFFGLFFSCSQKIYQKTDYPFYDSTFKLNASSALRTDGVYVLDHIWTDENGGTTKPPKEHRFYKFYATGQSNLTLDPSNEIKTKEQYLETLNGDYSIKNKTLFEGYYKLEKNKIVIQSVVVPRQQFEYKYGYLEKDTLIIVKSTTDGRGKFEDKNFTKTYKEYYVFMPLDIKNGKDPQW